MLTLHRPSSLASLALIVVLSLACTGCGVSPLKLTLNRGQTLEGKSVDLDIVGVNDSNIKTWSEYPISKYFEAGNEFRDDARRAGVLKTVVFRANGSSSEIIDKTDPIWAKWKEIGAKQIVVIANLPGDIKDTAGEGPARKILLWDNAWPSDGIKITVGKGALSVDTARKE
jgi:hypothetical protein